MVSAAIFPPDPSIVVYASVGVNYGCVENGSNELGVEFRRVARSPFDVPAVEMPSLLQVQVLTCRHRMTTRSPIETTWIGNDH